MFPKSNTSKHSVSRSVVEIIKSTEKSFSSGARIRFNNTPKSFSKQIQIYLKLTKYLFNDNLQHKITFDRFKYIMENTYGKKNPIQ